MKKLLFVVLSLVVTSTQLIAADMYRKDNYIFISNGIDRGDYIQFRRITNGLNGLTIILNSGGGDFYEGIRIAELVRQRNYATVVLSGSGCFSMCAVIWASGINRFANLPNNLNNYNNYSEIGFHNVYKGATQEASGDGNAILGGYFRDWGYSFGAIAFFTEKKASGLNYLTKNIANQLDIDYNDMSIDRTNGYNHQAFSQYPKHEEYNPINIAYKFYTALSYANGNLATSYVIPEKRGVGPFNENNIFRFYASLSQPLVIRDIRQIASDIVEVDYTYRAGRRLCSTTAIVETTYRYGRTLIKKIKAKC